MSVLAVRDRLVYPVAVVVALGAVTVSHTRAASPRFAEVSAVRLQAEVTSYVGGLADATVAGLASAPRPAASVAPAAATASAVGDTYPSTFFDKLIYSLPPNIRYAILPTLYVVASVIGAIFGVFYLIFGFPKELMPAAAVAPKRGPAASTVVPGPVGVQPGAEATSATPAVVPDAVLTAGHPEIGEPGRSAEPASAAQAGSRRPAPVAADTAETAETSVADDAGAAESVAAEPVPAPIAAEAAQATDTEPVLSGLAPVLVEGDAPAVDEPVAPAPQAVAVDDEPARASHPARAGARSAAGSGESAPERSARRSAR